MVPLPTKQQQQYNFYQQRRPKKATTTTTAVTTITTTTSNSVNNTNHEKVSHLIMNEYDKYQQMKQDDPKLKKYLEKEGAIRQQLLLKLNNSTKGETQNPSVKSELDQLNDSFNATKEERSNYLKEKLVRLYQHNATLFDLITSDDPPNRSTFESVLSTFDQVQKGGDRQTLIVAQFEQMRKKQGLPEGIFDYSKLDTAIMNSTITSPSS